MRIKQYSTKLGIAFVLGMLFLPTPTFATGSENLALPDQRQEAENGKDISSDEFAIGGGLNIDSEGQLPTVEKPVQPASPNISETLLPPEDMNETDMLPANESATPDIVSKPTSPTVISKPQVQLKSTSPVMTSEKPSLKIVETEDDVTVPVIIPTAPNDSVAPTMTEIPHTGTTKTQETAINVLAIMLLILSGITVVAAGIVNILLDRAAQRNRVVF